MNSSAILRLEGVTKQYESMTQPAVEQVCLELYQGELLSLLGPSGCGKTTLLRLIAGFEQTKTGSVELAGRRVDGKGDWLPPEHRDVGVVFQDYALFPHLTIYKNVAFGLKQRSRRHSNQEIRQRVKDAIALVGLEGLEQRYPHELSGGQQQRVALARALAPRPNLILLDEPFSNLDVEVRLYLRQEVRHILKKTGISAVFVTHDQEEALAISDRIGVMRAGHLEQLGTPEELYLHPASRFVAGFVTQANFVPAHHQGQVCQTEIGNFAIETGAIAAPDQPAALIDNPTWRSRDSQPGELMIRQEDLCLNPDEQSNVVVCDRQFLGREYRYCLQTPSGQELHARTPVCRPLPVGTRVRLSVPNQTLRFFPSPAHSSSTPPSTMARK
jgi:iron(III) transport system ATP-binding protein